MAMTWRTIQLMQQVGKALADMITRTYGQQQQYDESERQRYLNELASQLITKERPKLYEEGTPYEVIQKTYPYMKYGDFPYGAKPRQDDLSLQRFQFQREKFQESKKQKAHSQMEKAVKEAQDSYEEYKLSPHADPKILLNKLTSAMARAKQYMQYDPKAKEIYDNLYNFFKSFPKGPGKQAVKQLQQKLLKQSKKSDKYKKAQELLK